MKIIISNLQKKIPIYPKRIKKAILRTLSAERVKKSGELNFCFVTDKKIQELNYRYLGKNRPTDVLAFNLSENKERILAEVIISADTAGKNAQIFKTSLDYELYLYTVHGLLHILGYQDDNFKDKYLMQEKAEKILGKLDAHS